LELRPPGSRAGALRFGAGCDSGANKMTGAIRKRIAKLEANRQGDQIPIICEEESEVPAIVDRMIEAGELAEADRSLCVYWLDCVGPNALTDAQLRELLKLCDAEEQRVNTAGAPETRQID
jgi:hypothetical protein